MKTQAIGYVRVSTLEQAEEGHSLDAQRTAIEQFCRARGWDLAGIKTDAGISGTLADRPALQAVLDLASKGVFDVVIVHAIDRFYRDLQGLLKALNHLRQHDVAFISITENLDFSTPWGKLTLAVLGTLAEIYIDRLRQETRKGKRARAAKGLHNGSPPLGYCYGKCASCADPNGKGYCPLYGRPNRQNYTPALPLVPHPVDREAVRLAFEWHASGSYSDGEIAEKLNAHVHTLPDGAEVRFRTRGRTGRGEPGVFSKDSVRDILQHPFYTGVVPYYGVNEKGQKRKRDDPAALYAGQHEPIVDQETFEESQRIRALMGRSPRNHENWRERTYILSGILRCGYCGARMIGSAGNGERYYRDKSRIQHTVDCTQSHVDADVVESQFARIVASIELAPNWREETIAAEHPDLTVEEVREREEEIQERLERAKRLYIEGDIDKARYEREKLKCGELLADLRPNSQCDILSAGAVVESDWHDLTPLQQKERSRTMFTTVLIRGDRLVAVKPTDALFALFRRLADFREPEEAHRISGSDGIVPSIRH